MRSWKTNVAGVATILGAVCQVALNYTNGQPIAWEIAVAQVTAGIGLLLAKDYDATHSVRPPTQQVDLEVK